jgi:hypothetical protein
MSDIANTSKTAEPEVTEAELLKYFDTFWRVQVEKKWDNNPFHSDDKEELKRQFLAMAKAYRLNPHKNEIFVAVSDQDEPLYEFSLVIDYMVYLKRAEDSGLLNGWETSFSGEGENLTCTITIYRKDWGDKPFRHEVFYEKSVQRKDGRPNALWATKPRAMLRKVAPLVYGSPSPRALSTEAPPYKSYGLSRSHK